MSKDDFNDPRIDKIAQLGKELENTLAFNSKLVAAIETSIEGIALLDENGIYIYVNRAHEEMFGYGRGELNGKSWTCLYTDKDVKHFVDDIFPIIKSEGFWRGEAMGLDKKGNQVPEALTLTAVEDGWLICTCREDICSTCDFKNK